MSFHWESNSRRCYRCLQPAARDASVRPMPSAPIRPGGSSRLVDRLYLLPPATRWVGSGEQKLKADFALSTTPRRAVSFTYNACDTPTVCWKAANKWVQAAYATGYRHPNNFSAAFAHFFGYPRSR
ncbi:hypothetical protein DSL92_05130 [Billgrantia gudaonensis]|uniref:Uncharacterized protein n=1 Tax=Billgrantia gudaonensis TaxID=376427 RepID=A0A432JJ65_9GAMM|nr:hypothetical protein DSL92_05130 [Halomonas gudaonensis]